MMKTQLGTYLTPFETPEVLPKRIFIKMLLEIV